MNLYSILSEPAVYDALQNLLGAKKSRRIFVKDYLKPQIGDKILDIGCGTARILDELPKVEYYGFDANPKYIDFARLHYGGGRMATFYCDKVESISIQHLPSANLILATGLLHHLSNDEVQRFCEIVTKVLSQRDGIEGRLVTIDPCFEKPQNPIARYLIKRDRGRYVRSQDEYLGLLREFFRTTAPHIRRDMLYIPYTHIIIESSV